VGRARAALGSAVFLVLAPGVVAGLVPWLLTGWETQRRWPGAVRTLGAVLIAVGAVALLHAFLRFVVEGLGTPAPVAPTERLVVGGLYRHVRNPMYLAVAATIVGQGLVFGSLSLLVYAAAFLAVTVAFVRLYEEPTLQRQFGAQYDAYRQAVPGWVPRLRPWAGDWPGEEASSPSARVALPRKGGGPDVTDSSSTGSGGTSG
jgi:protein-S-isoprenylcysteine O-methyltransferase Ste14